jgi:hypothetical protein
LDTAIAKQLSMARNMDPEAVFVVTGASRGIGLHLVEALQQRTKVSLYKDWYTHHLFFIPTNNLRHEYI